MASRNNDEEEKNYFELILYDDNSQAFRPMIQSVEEKKNKIESNQIREKQRRVVNFRMKFDFVFRWKTFDFNEQREKTFAWILIIVLIRVELRQREEEKRTETSGGRSKLQMTTKYSVQRSIIAKIHSS